jgi:hypothetical protein
MLVPVVRAGALVEIQRVRKLKYPGEVLAYEGQQVHPGDVIAETILPAEIVMFDIASSLGVDMRAAKDFLVRQPGEYLYEGDMIAQVSGTLPRLVRSPVTGQFNGLHQGKAVFESGYKTIKVQAGMLGVVQSVLPEYGAVLATTGLLLQGLWGNAAVGLGELYTVEETWKRPLQASMLGEVAGQAVIAAGSCLDPDVLTEISGRGAVGLLLGLIAPALIKAARDLPIPIIVLQGFGGGQPDPAILDWLKPQAGKTISLNASESDPLTGMRPEAIIHLDTEVGARMLNVREELRVGHQVRVLSDGMLGQVGKVSALPEGLTLFESGMQSPAAVVQMTNGDVMTVPQQNLFIIDDIAAG